MRYGGSGKVGLVVRVSEREDEREVGEKRGRGDIQVIAISAAFAVVHPSR